MANLMTPELISVVIPSYNREAFVRQAVDSALIQTWGAVEVIVVDDGSTDSTIDALAKYGTRIRLIRQENAGVAAARNTGIERAAGEWIALLDSDDLWDPDKLKRQMDLVRKWPSVVLVHSKCATIDLHGELYGDQPLSEEDRLEEDSLERLMHHCEPTTSSVLIKKSVLDFVGGFDVDFEQHGGFAAEDWELYLRLAERGPFAFLGVPLTLYRVHSDSKTLSNKLRHTEGLVALRNRIELSRKRWLDDLNRPGIVRALKIHEEQFAHVLGRLGLLCMAEGDWDSAGRAFRLAAKIEPKQLKHRLRIGIVSIRSLTRPQRRSG